MTKKYNCIRCEYETDVKEEMKQHIRHHSGFVIYDR